MITGALLSSLDAICRRNASLGNMIIPDVVVELEKSGYKNVRYYSVIPNNNGRPVQLLLRYWSGVITAPSEAMVIELTNALIHNYLEDRSPVLRRAHDNSVSKGYIDFDRKSQIEGMNNLHLPIFIDGRMFYEICVSKPENEDFSSEEISLLDVLSQMISNYCFYKIKYKVDKEIKSEQFNNQHKLSADRNSSFRSISRAAMGILDAEVVSHFRYGWHLKKIKKIGDDISNKAIRFNLDETYDTGEYLTGKTVLRSGIHCYNASQHENYQSITRSDCYNYYSKKIGKQLSIFYVSIPSETSIDIIRLICSQRNVLGIFTMEDCYSVEGLIKSAKGIMEAAGFRERERILRAINISSTTNVDDLTQPFTRLASEVSGDNIGEIGIFFGRSDSQTFRKAVFNGGYAKKAIAERVWKENINQPTIQRVMQEKVRFCQTARFCHELGISQEICQRYPSLIAIRASNSDYNAIFLIFLNTDITENEHILLTPELKQFFQDLGIVASHALAVSESHFKMDNAKRLMGQIGHELLPAVDDIGEAALDIIMDFKDDFSELIGDEHKEKLTEFSDAAVDIVNGRLRSVQRTMDIAVAMAQEVDNQIDVTFEYVNLFHLVSKIAHKIESEEVIDYQGDRGIIAKFNINEATKNLDEIIADKYLLERILLNVMRNALKYSTPPGGGKPIEIDFHTNPQTNLINLQIINWGSPIPVEDRDLIFDPFYRGKVDDPIRGRRGMGLGLFVANRFAQVHGGQVTCLYSNPKFDDPLRRDREGHETAFEIRFSRHLPLGPSKFNFKVPRS